MKLILPATAFLALALLCAPAQAQSDAEQAGQQACGNDVFSMCGDAIPDRGRIEACLRRNYSRVSATCRHYMASYGRTHGMRTAGVHRYTRHHVRSHSKVRRHHTVHHYGRHHTRRHYDYR
ncbi:MAG TPA: hypothetical protein VG270_09040 [Pseudolabrys sp.]|jgi:hypothetical protein|nr:hypothetical protein [Pseudolabrys sp.]